MSSLDAAIRRAKKLLRAKEKANSEHANQLFVVTEYNTPLTGELVIILDTSNNK